MAANEMAGARGAVHRATEEVRRRPYVQAFGVLAVLTFVEIQVPSLPIAKVVQIAFLIALAATKASLVVAYYMHLRYEPRVLAYLPLAPLILVAALVLVITL